MNGSLPSEPDDILNAAVRQTANRAVSVVIPFRGAEADLRRCLESVEGQTYRDFEVIVVADGVPVPDAVCAEVFGHGISVTLIHNQDKSGPFASRRLGAESASGDYVWFVDHDDSSEAGFLATAMRVARENGIQVVECPILVIQKSGEPFLVKRFQTEVSLRGDAILEAFLAGRSHNNLFNKLIQKQVWDRALESIGTVHEQALIYAEDMLCMAYVYSHAQTYQAVDGTQYVYIHRADSTMGTRVASTVAQSLRSLALVMEILEPLLARSPSREAVDQFVTREVGWALNHLVGRVDFKLSTELQEIVSTLRSKYLPASGGEA